MTDHELLELAAKAAEIKLYWTKDGNKLFKREGGQQTPWNPLEHDGDAFRLGVKLELDLLHSCISVRAIHRDNDTGSSIRCRGTNPKMDPLAAARRAIVRAAAAIGKEMT